MDYPSELVEYAWKFWELSNFEGRLMTPQEIATYDKRWLDAVFKYNRYAKWYKEQKEAHEKEVQRVKRELETAMPGRKRK